MSKAIYPGSFDPITNGHLDVLNKALKVFDEVIILVADNPKKKSRFSVSNRVSMIKDAIKGMKGVSVDSTSGLTVEYAKKVKVMNLVRGLRNATDYAYEVSLSKAYHELDKNITMTFFLSSEENADVSSSKIEELFLKGKDIKKFVPKSVVEMYKKRWPLVSSFYIQFFT